MNTLVVGLVIFYAIHCIPNIGNTRARLIGVMGEKGYMPFYALLSLLGMVLLVQGKGQAEFIELWQPPVWGRHITHGLMLLSMACFAAIFLPTNIKRKLHHPMLAFVAFWGLAHLSANGDLASVLLFGSFFVFAIFKTVSLTRRKPPQAKPAVAVSRDILWLIVTAVIYGGGLYLHPYISGGFVLL
ncbi:NnrU family protein [Oceanicoccus sp. KOV_DT_Chl]|uniref:NnrU family protein n=1 Tax=Oceanicoccus sp. KOV_DT_Chl TaxID=1904639 RepID=UPI000C7987F0|nr:NnrU family protein [Oceanicoccus sp. KOV_DT_Chl]